MFYKLKSKASIEFWVILALFIIGLFVRLYHLEGCRIGHDEVFTVIRIDHSLLDTVLLLKHSEFPPLYYVILNLWAHAFGNGEWALRFISVIFSSLTIVVIYKLGKELFSKEVGIISALLLTFSPFALNYAQYAKMYALFWFLAAVSFLFFFRFLKDQGKGSYKFYIMASVLCCYTMYTGFLFLVTQSIIFLLMGERKRWIKWFMGQLIIIAFCVPWLVLFICSKHFFLISSTSSATFDYFTFFGKCFLLIIGSCPDDLRGSSGAYWGGDANCFLYVFLIIFLLISAVSCINKKIKFYMSADHYCLLIWMIIPTFIYFIFDYFFFHVKLGVRYIGFLQVPIILLVSSQINNLPVIIKRVLVLIMLVIAIANIYVYFRDNTRYSSRAAEDMFIMQRNRWFGNKDLAKINEDTY